MSLLELPQGDRGQREHDRDRSALALAASAATIRRDHATLKQRNKTKARKTASPAAHPGSERARDEQRGDAAGPLYGGGAWQEADRRGDDRFGNARNDDADPSELSPREAANDDNDAPNAADPDLAAAEANREIESGGQREGMGRGEKPRKSKARQK